MSNIRKLLDTINEMATVSGSVATVATPMGPTQRRNPSVYSEEKTQGCHICQCDPCKCNDVEDSNGTKAPEAPKAKEFGLWANSILAGAEQRDKKKSKKSVKEDKNINEWRREGEWVKSSNKDPRGKVTHLSDIARRETEQQKRAHEYNMDAAQREIDRRAAEGEDMSGAKVDPNTYRIIKSEQIEEKWSQKYKDSINCSHPKGFSQKAHCAGKNKNESATYEMTCPDCGTSESIAEACWKGYHKDGMKTMFGKKYPNCVKNKNESLETYIKRNECPGCGGLMVSESQLTEKKDACYHKVKSRYKVWPSAYASGALVKCRKVGADNWGNSTKNESVDELDENLHQWFKEKWVRFGPDGKIRGDCARGDDSEGKPKCLPRSKAYNLGKKGRASAAARKRREDPNPDRAGSAINVNTKKKKTNESITQENHDVMRHRGDKTIKIVKKAGKPIGEIGIDAEASPGNGQYYVKLYDGSYDAVGFDTAEEALTELKYAIKQTVKESSQPHQYKVGQKANYVGLNKKFPPFPVVITNIDDEYIEFRSDGGKPIPGTNGETTWGADPGWKVLEPVMTYDPNSLVPASSWAESKDQNELASPKIQDILAKMSKKHGGEQWSKEQLAALGKKLAAADKKTKVDELNCGAGQRQLILAKEDRLEEQDIIVNPNSIRKVARDVLPKINPRKDHEVEMARSDLYQAVKNGKQIYDMIESVSEDQGLEGWVQEKIIKAADYLNTVREYLEGEHVKHMRSLDEENKTK